MRILLVDDNEAFRKSLKTFLEGEYQYTVVGEMADGKEFLDAETVDADVVLMDINMPGINGLLATKKRLWMAPHLKIIAVSQHQYDIDLELLIGSGFKGFVSKTNLYDDLQPALLKVKAGLFSFPADIKIAHDEDYLI
ncbi:MAG: response regulator transcription factor [Salinivirgaceae bacterium]